MTLPLSIFVIARDEADRIGRTLAAVRHLTDDLVVVDSGSRDDTVAIAERHGARVVLNAWAGYGPQKRFAEDLCRHRWLLNLDADEVVPGAMANEIAALFSAGEPPLDAYRTAIAEIFPGEARPSRFAYALSPVRLYARDKGRYCASPVFDRVELAPGARVGKLAGSIHHFTVRSLSHELEKFIHYTDQQVNVFTGAGRRVFRPRLLVEFPAQFVKAYLFRRHCLRGWYGFLTAMNFAYGRHLRLAKLYERQMLDEQAAGGRQAARG